MSRRHTAPTSDRDIPGASLRTRTASRFPDQSLIVITEFAEEPLNLPRAGHAKLPGGGQRDYFA
jgi:hypothetical protein